MAENFVSSVSSEEFDKALLGGLDAANGKFAKTEDIPTVPVQSVNGKTGNVNLVAADVGADPAGTAVDAVSAHNADADAHNDIRLLIEGLVSRLNALADSDDTTLDQMSEIVTYIKANKTLIDSITTSKVNVSDIINNLTTNVSNKPLSAAQGVILKGLIDSLSTGKLDVTAIADWAKAATKPSYTKNEVGLGNVDNVKQYSANNPPPYPVTSVNGATGAVTVAVPEVVQTIGASTTNIMSQKAVTDAIAADGAPGYVAEEAEEVAKRVYGHQNANTFSFLTISDMHEHLSNDQIMESNLHAGQGMDLVRQGVHIDFGVVLGDNGWGSALLGSEYRATIELGVAEIRSANKKIDKALRGIPNFRTPGNHDGLMPNYTFNGNDWLDNSELFPLYGAYNTGAVHPAGEKARGYCYRDFEDFKVRVICMNTSDNGDLTPSDDTAPGYISGTQQQWLAETIDLSQKADAEKWGIIILSHYPLDYGLNIRACAILKAYLDGGSITQTFDGVTVSYDYAGKNKAAIIANIHGHNHCLLVDNLRYRVGETSTTEAMDIMRCCVPNACFDRTNERGENDAIDSWDIEFGEATSYEKVAGTAEDTSFYVITVDTEQHRVFATCYGAGEDREFSYTVPPSYTNQISIALDTWGGTDIYNGKGYKESTRIGSDGTISTVSGMCSTGFIPCTSADTLRLKNVTPTGTKSPYVARYMDGVFVSVSAFTTVFPEQDEDGTYIGSMAFVESQANPNFNSIRLSLGVIDDTSILTINEEIP